MSPIGTLRYLTEAQFLLERRVETAGKEVCHDVTPSSRRHGRRPERGPYSAGCVELDFSHLDARKNRIGLGFHEWPWDFSRLDHTDPKKSPTL
jgi:hypothetical protein